MSVDLAGKTKIEAIPRQLLTRGYEQKVNWTFRIDDALDISMLQSTLEELITTAPNWRKLGGRFRRGVSTCELHHQNIKNLT